MSALRVPDVQAGRVVVIDCVSGDTLYEKSADDRVQVASTQKLLTALVVHASGDVDRRVTFEAADSECLQVRLDIPPGDSCARGDLVAALLVGSANDAAHALARDCAGSRDAFAASMNRHAAALGAVNSHFTNPTGLPDDRQYSTARDVARIALEVDRSPRLRTLVGTRAISVRSKGGVERHLATTNRLLAESWCDGMKTGFTKAAGHCLVSSAGSGSGRRIVVLLGGSADTVWDESRALLEWSLRQ